MREQQSHEQKQELKEVFIFSVHTMSSDTQPLVTKEELCDDFYWYFMMTKEKTPILLTRF